MKLFAITQNNSGGTFDVDEQVCHRMIFEADSEEEALALLAPMIENQSGSCPCCGDRWSGFADEIDVLARPYQVQEYGEDAETRWAEKYGKFDVASTPSWSDTAWGERKFEGKILFRDIAEYVQFLADEYGWTTPDARIFYKDGTVKEFFKNTNT